MLQSLLQEARAARRAALPRRAGSGRMVTKRPVDVTFQPVPQPPTPYCPTPEVAPLALQQGLPTQYTVATYLIMARICVGQSHGAFLAAVHGKCHRDEFARRSAVQAPVEVASLPCTPGTALHAPAPQATARSTVGRRSRSASFDTPMEGVPERPGPVLQPKTPALVHHPLQSSSLKEGSNVLALVHSTSQIPCSYTLKGCFTLCATSNLCGPYLHIWYSLCLPGDTKRGGKTKGQQHIWVSWGL